MKRLILLVSALILTSILTTSCLRNADESPLQSGGTSSSAEAKQTIKNIATKEPDEEPSGGSTGYIVSDPSTDNTAVEPEVKCPINFYVQSPESGSYVRCDREWSTDFLPANEDGSPYDLAVFALIPSDEPSLGGASYSDVWKAAATEAGLHMDSTDVAFEVSYVLESGENEQFDIKGPGDAEEVGEKGYIEMYLYDDVHQTPGVRYSHLTEETLNDWCVVTTVKLTAGEKIDNVEQIFLNVRIAPKGEEISSGVANIQVKRPAPDTDGETGTGTGTGD